MSHLGNFVVSNQKFVLFKGKYLLKLQPKLTHHMILSRSDYVGLERNSLDILANILKSQNESQIITDIIPATELTLSLEKQVVPFLTLPLDKSVVILPPASRLFQQFFASDIFKMIHKLKNSPSVKQVFLWLTLPNFPEHDHLPEFVEHMADIVVKLQTRTELELLIRKSTGSVTRKPYQYELKEHFMVTEIKKRKEEVVVTEVPKVKPESLGTFKIELSEQDKIARSNLVLPFEK